MPVVTPSRQVNFDLLRLLAVGIVVYGNGLILSSQPPSALWGAPLPRIGLDLLFAVSGFLAGESWLRTGRVLPFLGHRALRLFPALVACVLVTVFVIGPLATRLPLRAYLLDGMTRRFLANMLLVPQLWLPRVFEGQQWVGTVNPMLWTLAPGLLGCAAVAVVGRLPPAWRVPAMGTAALLCAALSLLWPLAAPHLPPALVRPVIPDALVEMPFFLVGATLSLLQRQAGPALWRADLAMIAFALNWMVATWLDSWTIVPEWVTVPYMAACFGRTTLPGTERLAGLGNPSYGMFLYAFPLQQLIVQHRPEVRDPVLACFVLAGAAGLLSWHLVERPSRHLAGLLRLRFRSAR